MSTSFMTQEKRKQILKIQQNKPQKHCGLFCVCWIVLSYMSVFCLMTMSPEINRLQCKMMIMTVIMHIGLPFADHEYLMYIMYMLWYLVCVCVRSAYEIPQIPMPSTGLDLYTGLQQGAFGDNYEIALPSETVPSAPPVNWRRYETLQQPTDGREPHQYESLTVSPWTVFKPNSGTMLRHKDTILVTVELYSSQSRILRPYYAEMMTLSCATSVCPYLHDSYYRINCGQHC